MLTHKSALTREYTGLSKVFRNLRKLIPIKTGEEREAQKAEKSLNDKVAEHNDQMENNPEYAKAFDLYKRMIHRDRNGFQMRQIPDDWGYQHTKLLPEISSEELGDVKTRINTVFDYDVPQDTVNLLSLASFSTNVNRTNIDILNDAVQRIPKQRRSHQQYSLQSPCFQTRQAKP